MKARKRENLEGRSSFSAQRLLWLSAGRALPSGLGRRLVGRVVLDVGARWSAAVWEKDNWENGQFRVHS